jgi:hypothetical protein
VKSDEGANFFWARRESSKTESISELFPPFVMKASVYGDRPKNTVWVLYPVMKARENGDSDGFTLEEELN